MKNFGYGFLVVSFGLERVPMLVPQHISVEAGLPREPKLMRWVAVMAVILRRVQRLFDFLLSIFIGWRTKFILLRIFLMLGWIIVVTQTWLFNQESNGMTQVKSFSTFSKFNFIFLNHPKTDSKKFQMQMWVHSDQPLSGPMRGDT